MRNDIVVIRSDGGARGNPGPAACAFFVEKSGKILVKRSVFLGTATNNIAEYGGVLMAVGWLSENKKEVGNSQVIFYLDSELVVRQLNRVYKVKDQKLKSLNLEIKGIIAQNSLSIIFKNIPRKENRFADFLVNQRLDISVREKIR